MNYSYLLPYHYKTLIGKSFNKRQCKKKVTKLTSLLSLCKQGRLIFSVFETLNSFIKFIFPGLMKNEEKLIFECPSVSDFENCFFPTT